MSEPRELAMGNFAVLLALYDQKPALPISYLKENFKYKHHKIRRLFYFRTA